MTRTEAIQRMLEETNDEIQLLVDRMSIAHTNGDNNTINGISYTFNNNIEWSKRLNQLRIKRNKLELLLDGVDVKRETGVFVVDFVNTEKGLY